MNIHHTGIFVSDLEVTKIFFEEYFGLIAGEKYYNPAKKFSSYMLSSDSGISRIEIMSRPDVTERLNKNIHTGIHHISFAVGAESVVDTLAARLASDGYEVLDGPRKTGDGFYECCIRGIEGILIEICSESR